MDTGQAAAFIDRIFGRHDWPEQAHVLLWTAPAKLSTWVHAGDLGTIPAKLELIGQENVYVGCTVAGKRHGEKSRGPVEAKCGIPALWMDIDVAHPLHAKKSLPPSTDEALEFIRAFIPAALFPPVVVQSGHGLQLWWPFKESWVFEDESDRGRAAHLSWAMHRRFSGEFSRCGWAVDSCFDLQRVMRLPGTVNWKDPEDPRPVTYVDDGRDFNPEDFSDWLNDQLILADAGQAMKDSGYHGLGREEAARVLRTQHSVILPPTRGAVPILTEQRLITATSLDDTLDATWKMKRKGKLKDGSLSAYDLSLLSQLASFDFSPQELAEALILFRHRHGQTPREKMKAFREDYVLWTITRAMERSVPTPVELLGGGLPGSQPPPSEGGPVTMDQLLTHGNPSGCYVRKDADSPEEDEKILKQRAYALAYLRDGFGCPIIQVIQWHFVQRIKSAIVYTIILKDPQGVELSTSEMSGAEIRNFAAVSVRIQDLGFIVNHRRAKKIWCDIANMITQAAELRTMEEAHSPEKWVKALVREFLAVHQPTDSILDGDEQALPFIWRKRTYLYPGTLLHYYNSKRREQPVEYHAMIMALGKAGLKEKRLTYKSRPYGPNDDRRKLTTRAWEVPTSMFNKDDQKDALDGIEDGDATCDAGEDQEFVQ